MFKALFHIKRKPGLSHEQFRHHFETVHVKMAQKYFGHLMIGYQRNYPSEVIEGARVNRSERQADFDCISEWMLPDRAAFDQIMAMFADPVIGQEFYEDEENFLDRESTMLVLCDDVVDTGTDGQGRLRPRR